MNNIDKCDTIAPVKTKEIEMQILVKEKRKLFVYSQRQLIKYKDGTFEFVSKKKSTVISLSDIVDVKVAKKLLSIKFKSIKDDTLTLKFPSDEEALMWQK